MRRCLVLISMALLCCLTCWSTESEYGLLMQVRGRDITGLCIIDTSPDGSVVGTVVNEMGVKAFDFTYANGKAKVLNVIGPMNKWYIRRVISRDFSFIINNINGGKDVTVKRRSLRYQPNGDIVATNDRYKISYTFTPQKSGNETD